LPPGWSGKLWAVSEGLARIGEADYVLLTDADIVHGPGTVAELVGRAEAGGYDLVSLMALLRCESVAERLLVPAFVFFFFMLYPPEWTADPHRRTAGAAGGCILIRREMLHRIGGVASVRGEIIDDCALAAAVKRAGGRLWLGTTRDMRSLRVYGTFAEIGRMVSRTAFAQLRHSGWLLAGTAAGMAITYLAPPVLALRGNPLAAAAWLAMSVAYAPMLRFYRRSALWAPLLPAVAAFYMGATVHSALRYWAGAGGEWKGRLQDATTRPARRLPGA
jgi:hopene-associated glycosyltransferase HpnB